MGKVRIGPSSCSETPTDEPLAATTYKYPLGPPGSELRTRGFDQADQGDARRLWNVAPKLPAGRNFTRIFQGRPELIDHILVQL